MHYQKGKNRDQVFMTSMDQMVPEDSWARVVDLFVDVMPVLSFGFNNSKLNKEGNLPYHPADLFKLLLYGYRKGIRSANQLHEASRVNVEVMWLMKGLRPSARTICYFRSENGKAIEKAHRHFVKLLRNWKLIDGELLAVDGTKVRAQNSLKNNFNAKKIDRHLEYIDGKINDYLDQLDEVEEGSDPPGKKQEKIRQIEQEVERYEKGEERYEQLKEQVGESEDGQVSLTDSDARMVIKRRNITEVGYNIQATADGKYKLIVDVFSAGVNDLYAFGKASRRSQEILGRKRMDMLADAGYHNGVEIAYAERRGIRPFVCPRENHPQKQAGFRKDDFQYDRKTDAYHCPAGELLKRELEFTRGSTKKPYRVMRYGTPSCKGCRLRINCTTSRAGRKIERPVHQAYVDRNDRRVERYPSYYRLQSAGRLLKFLNIRSFGNFGCLETSEVWVRGRTQEETEYRLAAICYNLQRSVSILGLDELKRRLRAFFWFFLASISAQIRPFRADFKKFSNAEINCQNVSLSALNFQ